MRFEEAATITQLPSQAVELSVALLSKAWFEYEGETLIHRIKNIMPEPARIQAQDILSIVRCNW